MIENTSNVVVNATITEGHAADSPRFEKLVTRNKQRFPNQRSLSRQSLHFQKELRNSF